MKMIKINYEIDIDLIASFLKRVIHDRNKSKNNSIELTIEDCHEISELLHDFTPKRIFSQTNSEREQIETMFAKEVLRKLPFLAFNQGFEMENGLLSSLSYNLFQFLAKNFVQGEAWRLENVKQEVNNSFLEFIK